MEVLSVFATEARRASDAHRRDGADDAGDEEDEREYGEAVAEVERACKGQQNKKNV